MAVLRVLRSERSLPLRPALAAGRPASGKTGTRDFSGRVTEPRNKHSTQPAENLRIARAGQGGGNALNKQPPKILRSLALRVRGCKTTTGLFPRKLKIYNFRESPALRRRALRRRCLAIHLIEYSIDRGTG